jgi:hypothetical protein
MAKLDPGGLLLVVEARADESVFSDVDDEDLV